jgi:hypothetical protein
MSATWKRIPNGFGIPNPELLNPDFRSGLGIYKSRGIGIPLGTTACAHHIHSFIHSFDLMALV